MAKVIGTVEVNRERCKGCNLCVVACPQKVLKVAEEVNGRGYHYSEMVHPDDCIGCKNCATVCPDSVIEVWRMKVA